MQVAKMIHTLSSLPISSSHRVAQILFHPTQPFLAVQSSDKAVEIFRIRTIDEVKKKQARRQKREKEKKQTKANGKPAKVEDEDDHDGDLSQIKLQDLYTPYMIVRGGGRVRSFSFADNQANTKAVQVCFLPSLCVGIEYVLIFGGYSYSSHYQTTPSKSTPSPSPSKNPKTPSSPAVSTPSSSPDIAPTSALCVSAPMIFS